MENGKSASLDKLKTVATAFCEAAEIQPKTLSWRIFDDGKKLDAILADKADLMTANFEKAMLYLSTNWPAGAKWPKGIARPVRAPAAAE